MALVFICSVVVLFAVLFIWEAAPESRKSSLHPAGLLRWLVSGNWSAKVGALLVSIGAGALLRYLMLTLTFPPIGKLMAGVAMAAGLSIASAALAQDPRRRAISLALAGAALAVAYLTAYSAYSFFHFVADVQALGLLFMVACTATVIALTRRALSIAVLAMIGAYIAPAFALHASGPVPVYGYYAAASSVTLVMVWQRGWRPLIHLSFLFTLAGALFFCWTQKLYAPQYYAQMQPLLLALVALHLAMPLLETPSSPVDAGDSWSRRFDRAYFLLLPIVAAVLTLMLAPHVQRDGAVALAGLGGLWLIAAGAQRLRFGVGSVHYLSVAAIFLVVAGLLAVTDVPIFLIASVAMCLTVAASGQLRLSSSAELLVSGVALVSAACYVLQALFESASGLALFNGAFLRHALLGAALVASGWSLGRRGRALAPVFLIFGTTWLITALARELVRLKFVYLTEISYLGVITAISIVVGVAQARSRPPSRMALALFGVALLVTGALSSSEFSPTFLIPLMLAGQILYSLLALQCDRDPDNEFVGAVARSVLPALMLPWAVAFNDHLAKPHVDAVYTLLVSSALFASLQAQWLVRRARVWPNWLSPVGFVIFGALLLYESLFHIEREGWAVAFELIALIYVVETARFLSLSKSRDARLYEYVAIVAVASVSAAVLLRLMGPPGTLTILALNQMLLPAVVSLLWAAIGALLSWLSTRNQSRTLWSLGTFLLVAAALKLILLDFGSLGQIGNILAMLAAGGVFLLVAWLAPFPPRAAGPSDPEGIRPADGPPSGTRRPTDPQASIRQASDPPASHSEGERSNQRGWIWVLCALVLVIAYAKWFAASHRRNIPPPVPPGELQQQPQPDMLDAITVPIAPLPVDDHVVVGNALPAEDVTLQATYATPPSRDTRGELRPQIASATYASPRNGRSLDVTTEVRSQCQAGVAGCVVVCNNDLAGDPDFGQGKTCEIHYQCGENPAQTLRIPEGRREWVRCE
jgi:Predicted membrane protein (DUF2339)